MIALNAFNIKKSDEKNNSVTFEIGPLPKGYGNTLGNILRRILLSSVPGSAIVGIKLEGVQHEYSTMEGLKDDVLTILLSLKNVVVMSKVEGIVELKLSVKGKKGAATEVKASDIESNSNVTIVNKDYVITKLTDDRKFDAVLYVASGIGYSFPDQNMRKELGVLPIDASFSPVTLVSYDVTPTRVGHDTDLDQLNLTVKTNGAMKSDETLYVATNILNSMASHLFSSVEVLTGKKVVTPISLDKLSEEVRKEEKSSKPLPVSELNLSTRLTNALLRSSYEDLNQLSGMTEEELANIKGMGQKSLDELIKVLNKHGVKII